MVEGAEASQEQTTNKLISFNLMMIGDGGVGKTSIMKRYVNKKFDPNKIATSGVDF